MAFVHGRRDSPGHRHLQKGFDRVMMVIDKLDDEELLRPGVFAWAGKWPIARWISINTARQYTTARTFIRRALREQKPNRPGANG